MNKLLSRLCLFALSGLAIMSSATAATDVGVSVSVNQPGFYGRVDIGNQPPPVIYAEPVIIHRRHTHVVEPVYMRVPPGHRKKWSRYCGRYNACNQPVYFVRDDGRAQWHDHQGQHRHDKHDHHDHDDHPGKGHGKGHGKSHH